MTPLPIQSNSKDATDTHPPHPAAVFFEKKEEEETSQEIMTCQTPQSVEKEVELEPEGLPPMGEDKFSTCTPHSEKLDRIDEVGIRLNAQLEALVRNFTLEEVKQAIAYYLQTKRTKESKGQKIDRPAGWLTDCLRQRWWQTAREPEKSREQEEFEQWYAQAIASGIVEDVPLNYLPQDSYGQPLVRVGQPGLFGTPYTLVSWRELWSIFNEDDNS